MSDLLPRLFCLFLPSPAGALLSALQGPARRPCPPSASAPRRGPGHPSPGPPRCRPRPPALPASLLRSSGCSPGRGSRGGGECCWAAPLLCWGGPLRGGAWHAPFALAFFFRFCSSCSRFPVSLFFFAFPAGVCQPSSWLLAAACGSQVSPCKALLQWHSNAGTQRAALGLGVRGMHVRAAKHTAL